MKAHVYSSVSLSEKEKELIEEILSRRFGKVSVEYHVQSHILGGIRIEVDDWVFDGSIQERLGQLVKTLKS